MAERDADGFYPEVGGHLWRDNRGPDSHCARPGCGLVYARWSGDRCYAAPDCTAARGSVQCDGEEGHEGDHFATRAWQWSDAAEITDTSSAP
jgi:hypothetical protein